MIGVCSMDKKKRPIIKIICLAALALSFVMLHIFSYFNLSAAPYQQRSLMLNDIAISYPFFDGEEDAYILEFFKSLDNHAVNEVRYQVNFIGDYTNILFKSFYDGIIVDYDSLFFDIEGNAVDISHIISNEEAILSRIKDYVAASHLRISNEAIMRADKSFLFNEMDLEILLTNFNNLGHIALITLDYNDIINYLNVPVRLRSDYDPLPEREPEYIPTVPEPERRMVAFTFDDGPSRYTTPILDILDRYNARASFFMLGDQIVRRPEVVWEVLLRGHEIANHTMDHVHLARLSDDAIRRTIRRTDDALRYITGHETHLFRPPYGGLNAHIQTIIGMPIILWSVDSRDWESRNTDHIVNLVLNDIQDGDIVLFHDMYASTIEAIKTLLPILAGYNFEVVSVSELFAYNNIEPSISGIYRHAR